LSEDTSNLIVLVLIGVTLIGGSAWFVWSNRRWDSRR
jgi:LPXTG-motif cell wall-anchored protein